MPLTIDEIDSAKPGLARNGRITSKSYKLNDCRGLYVIVSPTGGKWWRFRYHFRGRQNTLSCGVYPTVSLEQARRQRDAFRALLENGIDPSAHMKVMQAARLADEARLLAASRFTIDSDGALSLRLGKRYLTLTPAETADLRAFLHRTTAANPKVTPCP